VHVKNLEHFCGFNWQLTSQALRYDVITYTPYEGLNSNAENILSVKHLKFK